MNWININIETVRGIEYISCEPLERATWLSLLAWCCGQENGGIITGALSWNDRKWQQLCGVTKKEAEANCDLFSFEGEDLAVKFYPLESEQKVVRLRENGKKGGRPPKKEPSQVIEDEGEKPQGYDLLNLEDNQKVTICLNEKKRKGKKRKEKKDQKEDSEILPFASQKFFLAWKDWMRYLSEKRKKPTPSTTKKQLTALSKVTEEIAIETIEKSIMNGWQGLFPANDLSPQSKSEQIRKKNMSNPC